MTHLNRLKGAGHGWLAELFDAKHLDETCQALAKASQPDEEQEIRREEMRQRIVKLDGELDAYRTVLRNEPDAAATVGRWIASTTQERRAASKPSFAASRPPG